VARGRSRDQGAQVRDGGSSRCPIGQGRYESRVDPSIETREERDSLGTVAVPRDALYGAHTVRAIANFGVSGVTMDDERELIAALAYVKAAAARANLAAGELGAEIASAIVAAAHEVATGGQRGQFPIDVVHGGGGTAVNMNVNEVIANRANELLGGARGTYDRVHPNDHVNRSQSTNDVYPTALALATHVLGGELLERVALLEAALTAKAVEAGDAEHLGRTCLQDAVPLRIADTHLSQAHALGRTADALATALSELLSVPLGATAVGTGIGAPFAYRAAVIELLADETGLAVRSSPNRFDALAHNDAFFNVAAQLYRVSAIVARIASDLRLLASAPIGEIRLPAVQVGSSIMPGKVNPVMPELVLQSHMQNQGVLATVAAAVSAGELELNVMEPVIARHLLGGLREFGAVVERFSERCVAGLEWDLGVVAQHLAGSRAAAIERAASDGYDAVAKGG
jgi:aspartate ammonia-lyase